MKKYLVVILILFGTCLIQSAELQIKETKWDNPNMIEVSYKGIDGFWLSNYLAGKSAIALNQMATLKTTLGFTDENFAKKTKQLHKMTYMNKILVGIILGGILMWLGCLAGMCIYIGLSISEKGISFQERY